MNSHGAAVASAKALGQQTDENEMLTRTHVGISLVGFVASAGGLPAWDAMPTFIPGSHGYDEISAECDAVIMGRGSVDQGFEHRLQSWPSAGTQVYVLISQPLPTSFPTGVFGSLSGPAGLLQQVGNADLTREVLLLRGPRTIQDLMDLGALDRLGIVVRSFWA